MPVLEFRRVLLDRKSTRLNSSHTLISYAVFCLKKQGAVESALLRHDQHVRRESTMFYESLHLSRRAPCCLSRAPSSHLHGSNPFSFFFNNPAPPNSSPFPPHHPFPP